MKRLYEVFADISEVDKRRYPNWPSLTADEVANMYAELPVREEEVKGRYGSWEEARKHIGTPDTRVLSYAGSVLRAEVWGIREVVYDPEEDWYEPTGNEEIIAAPYGYYALTDEEKIAIRKVLDNCDFVLEEERIIAWYDQQDVTINVCRNGREVAWLLLDNHMSCVYVDTLEELTEEEVEDQLC